MKKIKIALDVDDVLAAFYPSVCKKFNKPEIKTNIWDGKKSCKWIADAFPDLWDDVDFWGNLNVLSYPQSITFDFECYMTSIDPTLGLVREAWLKRNGFPEKPLVCTLGSKIDEMKKRGLNMLIDDKPSTVKAVRKAGMYGIQFIPQYMSNYNDRDPFSIRHLSEVNQIIEELER
jgi:5'(3')-deoxyribonucleotidase